MRTPSIIPKPLNEGFPLAIEPVEMGIQGISEQDRLVERMGPHVDKWARDGAMTSPWYRVRKTEEQVRSGPSRGGDS